MESSRCDILDCDQEFSTICCYQIPAVHLCSQHKKAHNEHVHSFEDPIISDKVQQKTQKLLTARNKIIALLAAKTTELNELIPDEDKNPIPIQDMQHLIEKLNSAIKRLDEAIAQPNGIKFKYFTYKSIKNSDLPQRIQNSLLTSILGIKNPGEESRYNYHFSEFSKTLIKFDMSNSAITRIKLDTMCEELGLMSGICILEDGDIFYCGGTPTSVFDSTVTSVYKINPKTGEWGRLRDLPHPIYRIVPLRIDKFIYVFGGRDDQFRDVKTAFRYDIEMDHWDYMTEMPFASFNISAINVGTSILLSGYSSNGIWEYDFSGYKKILDSNIGFSVLFKNNLGEIFYINHTIILKSSEKSYFKWDVVSREKNYSVDYIENYYQQFGDYLFFKSWKYGYSLFNFMENIFKIISYE